MVDSAGLFLTHWLTLAPPSGLSGYMKKHPGDTKTGKE